MVGETDEELRPDLRCGHHGNNTFASRPRCQEAYYHAVPPRAQTNSACATPNKSDGSEAAVVQVPIKKPWWCRIVFASPSYSSLTAVRIGLSQINQCDLGSTQRVNALHASHERLPDVHSLLSETGGFTAYSKRGRDRPVYACVQFVDWIGSQMGISGGRAGVVVTEEPANPRQ